MSQSRLKLALAGAVLVISACSDSVAPPPGEAGGPQPTPAPTAAPTPTPAPTATPAPTPLPDPTVSYGAAFRFLRQASFGPTPREIEWVMANGIEAWVSRQLLAGSAYQSPDDGRLSHLQRTIRAATTLEPSANWYPVDPENPNNPAEPYFNGGATRFIADYQMSAWFFSALHANDQLRQRMAYALGQILVVSTLNAQLSQRAEAVAHYADILARHALGSFRTLIGEVARSPAMGFYLSHQGNEKANPERNTLPDENFARELMQLFTIGLYELNMDGTPRLDAAGELIPTYTQADIEQMARVMTGWDLQFNSRYGAADGSHVHLMEFNPAHHDYGDKQVLGQTIPLGLPNGDDLELALDLLFGHPSTAPFISKQLIQRLVTSNPSPAYVQRVAQVFVDNGRGQRGDLGAVARAILLDEEARDTRRAADPAFGKVDEQLLLLTRWLRAFEVRPVPGWRLNSDFGGEAPVFDAYWLSAQDAVGQGAFRAQHVFNFYDPAFVPQDGFFREPAPQLVLPELQLKTPNNIAGLVEVSNSGNDFLEVNHILLDHDSVQDFVADTNSSGPGGTPGWFRYRNLMLLDYGPALAAFEMAMEGDTDGDFAQINATGTDDDGLTAKQRGLAGLLDFLQHRLLGDQALHPAWRAQLAALLDSGDGYNLREDETRAEALRVTNGAVQYLLLSPEYAVLQ